MPYQPQKGRAGGASRKPTVELRKPIMDPAYMKDKTHCRTMETHDLGKRMSLKELQELSERIQNRPVEFSVHITAEGTAGRYKSVRRLSHEVKKKEPSSTDEQVTGPLSMTSNADVVRREIALQGEFDIISRSHIAKFEQDSAFKKDRIRTPEITALHNRPRMIPSSIGYAQPKADECES